MPLGLWVHSGHWFPDLADHPNELRELLLFRFYFFFFLILGDCDLLCMKAG